MVSGWTGIVTARTVYLSGLTRMEVTREVLGEKGEVQTEWFDAYRLSLDVKSAISAGPASDPEE